ncbi:PEP/pyruvate-binding domain-containing protein [Desulfocurvibacter africanus]|uniref:PEP/pyruvate-binding domain-containing protein n=1 Tax=Desulfocurvibacter africanus TaxID=873 RepID=UPI0004141EBA|nr:PEP/pyruvate-binding domain-containing protein [Desulfocurvibacter africanus]
MGFLSSLFRRRRKPVTAESLHAFRQRYVNFLELLESNSELLRIMAEIEDKLLGRELFGMSFVRAMGTRAMFHARRMVGSLDALSGGRHPAIGRALEEILERLRQELREQVVMEVSELVLPYERISRDMVDAVGGKNAHLGELSSRAGVPAPRGFAISTSAYRRFLRHQDLEDEMRKRLMAIQPDDPRSLEIAGQEIQELFEAADTPAELVEAVHAAYEQYIARPSGGKPRVALRSSAVGEDSALTYAGQYLTLLGVGPEDLIAGYKRVVASLFTSRAITYRLHKGVPFEDSAMSVACLEMVDARSAGVVFTRSPLSLTDDRVLVQSIWGLGPYAVDGVVPPDTFVFERSPSGPRLVERQVSRKDIRLALAEDGKLACMDVEEALREQPSLNDAQATELAALALRLEEHFGGPQDVEFALDQADRLFIVQSRPLRREGPEKSEPLPPVSGREVLLSGGETAFPGVGFGPVVHVRDKEDLLGFPDGGVLVAAHSSPNYVLAMPKARAILTDTGSVTGHMASLCREFGVPSILNLRSAVETLQSGELVTVDAISRRVYRGRVDELLALSRERTVLMQGTPVHDALSRLAKHIVPLHLTDPAAPEFGPQGCSTIHDITRLAHELSYSEMFSVGDSASDHEGMAVKLRAPIPLDLYLLDLGGGLAVSDMFVVGPEEVTSRPFTSVLRGMTDERLSSRVPKPVNIGGFLSVMSQQMLTPPNLTVERFGDKSYAIISDKYLNFSSRVGYHYSILDSYCGNTVNKNYVSFKFTGGAADEVRRNRRVRAIALILQRLGFTVEVIADRVSARIQKLEARDIEPRLEAMGRLLIFTRQMDMLMHSDASVQHMADCFIRGDFSCAGMPEK